MSHRALVAEHQSNGQFKIYHSRNGAENVQLLHKLRESLNINGQIDIKALTGEAVSSTAEQMWHAGGLKYRMKLGDSNKILYPNPVVTNVPREKILLTGDLLKYEVLYVVENGEVEAYWLTWTYPNVIQPWNSHVEMEVYEKKSVPIKAADLMTHFQETNSIQTISEFQQGWLSDEFARSVVNEYHREVYELQSMAAKEADKDRVEGNTSFPRVLQTPKYYLVCRVSKDESLVPQSYPFLVPIRLGSSPVKSSQRVKEAAAQTRFSIGSGLNATEHISGDVLRQACADSLLEIVEQHTNRVATELIPGGLGDAISEYQQSRSRESIENIWLS
jgi:hypothetical protein